MQDSGINLILNTLISIKIWLSWPLLKFMGPRPVLAKAKVEGKKVPMVRQKAGIIAILILGLLNASAWAQFERNRIYIVGASAAYPFARMVAKQTMKKKPRNPAAQNRGFREQAGG